MHLSEVAWLEVHCTWRLILVLPISRIVADSPIGVQSCNIDYCLNNDYVVVSLNERQRAGNVGIHKHGKSTPTRRSTCTLDSCFSWPIVEESLSS